MCPVARNPSRRRRASKRPNICWNVVSKSTPACKLVQFFSLLYFFRDDLSRPPLPDDEGPVEVPADGEVALHRQAADSGRVAAEGQLEGGAAAAAALHVEDEYALVDGAQQAAVVVEDDGVGGAGGDLLAL